jgi:hypothetical protein
VTFSDSRVAGLIRENFVAVWESVAPVKIAVFDLGEGKSVKGTVGGEIALHFCRPDGKVFDILPALHSPHVTYWAIRNALDFYRKTRATEAAVHDYQRHLFKEMEKAGLGEETPAIRKSKRDLSLRKMTWDPGTHAMAEMVGSKDGIFKGGEPMTVVEPGGHDYFKRQVRKLLAEHPLRTPTEWKEEVFVKVLDQELKGGEFKYDVDTLAPISIIEQE